MSNINDNNLDDLLRRAAEKYPLRTDSADWGKLVSDLEKDPSLILPPVGEDRRRRRRFFWLFLLLPLAGVGYYAWHAAGKPVSLADQTSVVAGKDGQAPAANSGGGHAGEKGQTKAQPEQGGHAEGEKGDVPGRGDQTSVPGQDGQTSVPGQDGQMRVPGRDGQVSVAGQRERAGAAEQNGQANVKGQDGQTETSTGKEEPGQVEGKNRQKNVKGRGGQESIPGQDGQVSVPGQGGQMRVPGQNGEVGAAGRSGQGSGAKQNGQKSGLGLDDQVGVVGQNGQAVAMGQNGQKGAPAGKMDQLAATTKEKGGHGRGEAAGRNSRVKGDNAPGDNATDENTKDENSSRGNITTGQDPRELHLASNNMQRVNTKMRGEVAAGNIPVRSNAKKDNIRLQKSKPSFYVGILGSPDLSTIKWQSVKNVGTRFGLLLGYSFDSRWSIESGAYYSRKNYYTDGEYFDKTNAYILKYVDQLKVNGVCNMWEFPLNVRYNLSTGEKMKWFATAGVSAYYMSKEKYDCSGYLNGAPWSEEWNKKPSHNSWSSNLNLSVGYEQRLGRIGNLRLEPYVRVPMTGIGTGKLSIMSAGLNIGITRRIW